MSRGGVVYFGTYIMADGGLGWHARFHVFLPSDDPGVYRNRGDSARDRQYPSRPGLAVFQVACHVLLVSRQSRSLAVSRVQVPKPGYRRTGFVGGGRNSPAPGHGRSQKLCVSALLLFKFSCNAAMQVDHLRSPSTDGTPPWCGR